MIYNQKRVFQTFIIKFNLIYFYFFTAKIVNLKAELLMLNKLSVLLIKFAIDFSDKNNFNTNINQDNDPK